MNATPILYPLWRFEGIVAPSYSGIKIDPYLLSRPELYIVRESSQPLRRHSVPYGHTSRLCTHHGITKQRQYSL
jgi:hypothetical protein